MKIEFDSEDLAIIGGVVVCVFLILALQSCEQVVDSQVKERIKQEQTK